MDDETKFDVRLVDRMIRSGRLEKTAYEKYLHDLPDISDKADNVDASLIDRGVAVEKKPAKLKKQRATKK